MFRYKGDHVIYLLLLWAGLDVFVMLSDVLMSVKCREPAVLLVCFVASDADGEVDLILVVGLRIDLADAALEDVAPSHVHEFGHLFVVDRGHIAEEIGCELCLAVHLGVFSKKTPMAFSSLGLLSMRSRRSKVPIWRSFHTSLTS